MYALTDIIITCPAHGFEVIEDLSGVLMRGVTVAVAALIVLFLVAAFDPISEQEPDATFLTDQELEQLSLAVSEARVTLTPTI